MKNFIFLLFLVCLTLGSECLLPAGEGKVSLFDGKTLAGWQGNSDLWSVKDGAIVGSSKPDGIKGNTFLVYEKPLRDFVLSLDFMFMSGNSGVQFRSALVDPEEFVVRGYQADIGEGCLGSLYDEGRRGMLLWARKDWTENFLKVGEWNHYVIEAIGNTVKLTLNGLVTAEYTEKDDEISRTGLVALQLHSGGPMEIRFKNIEVQEVVRKRLLYVTTAGTFAHASRPMSREVMRQMGVDSGRFDATVTDSPNLITPEGLKNFDGVMFYTQGDLETSPLSQENREALIQWIKDGHAFIGVHSAADTYKDWKPYWDMLGGAFNGHPWNADNAPIEVDVEDPSHPAAQPIPHGWKIQDEIYQFKHYDRARVRVILSMNEASIQGKGSRPDKDYALAWCRDHGQGKVFYTALGHREDVWTNPTYQAHLLGGILWTLGLAHGDSTPGHGKPSNEFVPLFDGETLSGWTPNDLGDGAGEGEEARWLVLPDGTLTGAEGAKHGHLFSPRSYGNFHYRAESNINDGGNSGMYFRARKGRRWPAGYEAQVNSTHRDRQRTGSLYGITRVYEQHVPPATWFTQEVIAQGDHIIIKVNGKVTTDVVVPEGHKSHYKNGHFAFQFHDPTCRVKYRNVEVRELP